MERALLQSLVDFLSYRGPDSHECGMDASIGLGHAMLRTTRQSRGERQPASLDDGRFWITADARLDGRVEFITELERSGRIVQPNAPDSELILHAYAAWGTPSVEHLRGDFSFAIWDARHKQLFCARDHFGIKPFYYLEREDLFLFSNTLNCIRMHPEVSGELNEAAIGDFLLFGLNCDNATTSFRDIQRLPPGHSLSISTEGLKIRRYWTPPTDGRIRYSKPEEYVENFKSLLESAVADRLRTDRAGILLSRAEPVDDPLIAGFLDTCRTISADCRVLLSGEGVDNLLDFQMWPYAGDLRRNGEWRRLLTDMANYFWIKPFPWNSIRTRMKRIIGKDLDMPVFPPWFNREFFDRAKLKARWKERSEHPRMPSAHPIVPHAHASLSLPRWTQMFERENAGLTPYPLEVRYPFLDLRIVNYLLALPPFPWFFEKILLREAMAQRIPERLRMRRKTPLAGDPVSAQLQKTGAERLNQIPWSEDSDRFMEHSALVPLVGEMSAQQIRTHLRPYCLNVWLQSARKVRSPMHAPGSG